jgi:hypothetical protein
LASFLRYLDAGGHEELVAGTVRTAHQGTSSRALVASLREAYAKHRLGHAAFVLPDFRPLVEALIALMDFRGLAEATPPTLLASGTSISRPLFTS